jgi:hypothetical protein
VLVPGQTSIKNATKGVHVKRGMIACSESDRILLQIVVTGDLQIESSVAFASTN